MDFQQIRDFVNPAVAQATGLQEVENLQMPVPVAYVPVQIVIDGALSLTSENPVQNKVIAVAIQNLDGRITAIEGQFSEGVTEAVNNWLAAHPEATTTVQDGAITYAKLDANLKGEVDQISELKSDLSVVAIVEENLFDKDNTLAGKRVVAGSGNTYNTLVDEADRTASNIIPVEQNTDYVFNSPFLINDGVAVYRYTDTGYYSSKVNATKQADGSFTFNSAGAYYIRFSFDPSVLNASTFMLLKGTTLPLEYASYGARAVVGGELFETKKAVERFDSSLRAFEAEVQNIDLGTLVNGYVNSTNGFFNDASSYKRTDYIPITSRKINVIDTFNASSVGFAFYDQYKKYISGFDGTGHNRGDVLNVTVPYNAKYFIYCAPNALVDTMQVSVYGIANAINQGVNNPIEYTGNEAVVFNKILCIGDSMTEGTFNRLDGGVDVAYIDTRYAYPTQLKAITGRDVTNKGDGGKSTKTWYAVHASDDLSGHDACIIELGINDAHGSPEAVTTSAERRTALTNIITKVKTDNPQIKIFLSTLFNTYKSADDLAVNADIVYIAENTTDCFLIDMATYGDIIKGTTGNRSDTANHLTAIGYRKLAKDYFAYMSWIIANNVNDFAFVQYAGTDYVYN